MNERKKNFAELLGRQETQGPFAVGGGRGEAGALAGDGVGHGLRIDRENWRVEGNGKAVSVTCKGTDRLLFLAEHPDTALDLPGIQDRKPTLDSEPRWVSPTKGQKRV